jgi:hypothetical protein
MSISIPRLINGILSLTIVLPIWFYLLYKILVAINASELMFFLYYIYLPVSILVRALADFADQR